MNYLKWALISFGSILLLCMSFILHVYSVDGEIKFNSAIITYNDNIKLIVSFNPMKSDLTWLPFYMSTKRYGPSKVAIRVDDLEKKWDIIMLSNVTFTGSGVKEKSVNIVKSATDIDGYKFSKKVDVENNKDYFYFVSSEVVPASETIELTVEFYLVNKVEKQYHKFKLFIEQQESKRQVWFTFLNA